MSKYNVFHDDDMWEIEASDLSGAQEIVLDNEGYLIKLKPEVETDLDVAIYHQRNKRYAGIKLGNSNLSFQNYGCFVCSLSFVTKRDPLEVNKLLADNGGMTNGGLILTPKAYELLGLKYVKTDRDINNMPTQPITIKEVMLGKYTHFVVRLVDKDGKRSIYDPWTNTIKPINYYSFVSYRVFDR